MKKIFIFVFSIISSNIYGQLNLVPNPSFEQYSSCPSAGGQVSKATGWNSYNTSDYFNLCASSSDLQVPQNIFGYQIPATGNAYCGFFSYYNGDNYHEFLFAQLSTPLIINQKYFISFKVSPADRNFCVYSNKTGAKFFTTVPPNILLNNSAQFHTNNIITDTAGWTKVSGFFTADSAYKFISIGNFFTDGNTNIIDNNCNNPLSYYFIDDVCLSTDSLLCNSLVPVSLSAFKVRVLNNILKLTWNTFQESNNKGFEILRSAMDGNHFKKIGFVAGAGFSSDLKQYSFNDFDITYNTEYFYQLKQEDFDDKASYSSVERGHISGEDLPEFVINPNPVHDLLRVFLKGK